MRWRTAVASSCTLNMKPPSPRDRDHRHVAERVLGAERGGDAPAERALVAGRDVGARRARLVGVARRIADLRELIDDDAVVRQHVADRAADSRAAARAPQRSAATRLLDARGSRATRSGRIGGSLAQDAR